MFLKLIWTVYLICLSSVLWAADEHRPKLKEPKTKYKAPPYSQLDGKVPRGGPSKQRRPAFRYDEREIFERNQQLNQAYQEERSKTPQAQPPYNENPRAHHYHPRWSPRPYHEADLSKGRPSHYRPPPWRPKKWWPSQGQYYIHQNYRGSTIAGADDRTLYLRIRHMLRGYNVNISVNTGHVSVWGSVNSQEEKQNIENILHAVNGVKNVNNQLTVSNTKAMPKYHHQFWRKNQLIDRRRRPYSRTEYPYHETFVSPDPKDPEQTSRGSHRPEHD